MTREEAKTWLNKLYARADITDEYGDMEDMQPYEEAVNMAIKALEQKPCDDVVSRDMALEKMADYVASGYADSVEDFEEYSRIICQLPSVRPQEQTKEKHIDVFEVVNAPWIFLDNCANSGYYCSKCKKKIVKDGWSETVKKINFCPNCGAKMVEPQESEDKG